MSFLKTFGRCHLLPAICLAFTLFGCAFHSSAQSQKNHSTTAVLLEAIEYSHCDFDCAPFNHPTTAYCFRAGDGVMVGERESILGETDTDSGRNLVGNDVTIRIDGSSVWLSRLNRPALRIKRGSLFEGFKECRCIIEVHKLKLALASKFPRPNNIPTDAFALSGLIDGDEKPPFRWFSCAMSPDSTTISCRKWSRSGQPRGVDHYCARTILGEPVLASFQIDQLLSRDGAIILTSGQNLARDDRRRVNDDLAKPGEACYQFDSKR
jgi:hypothetical protein